MVEYSVRWEIVNAMGAARRFGHGQIRPLLESRGQAPSSAYRWKKEFEWLLKDGPQEVRRLRRQVGQLSAQLVERGPAEAVSALPAKEERAFILEATARGSSEETIVALLPRVRGRHLSHETVHAIVGEAEVLAWVAFERFFAGRGTVAAPDELFAGRTPALLIAEPGSLLVTGAKVAETRTAADWEPLVAAMRDLEFCASDAGSGLTKAFSRAGIRRGADLFHLLDEPEGWLARFEKKLRGEWAAVEKARLVRERPPGQRGRPPKSPVADYEAACQAAERRTDEWCRLGDLLAEVIAATDLLTPAGQLNTAARAEAKLAEVLAAMRASEEGQGLAAALGPFERQPAFEHLRLFEEKLAGVRLDLPGPAREAERARLVAETLAWRRRDKITVEWLAKASTGSVADEAELAVLRAVDAARRSSSSIECINSLLRPVQAARKRLSGDFIYLWAVWHNLRPFGRGSVREGHSPAELAGIELPAKDWIDLLDFTAAELDRPAGEPSLN
jgi:hypothetical protein